MNSSAEVISQIICDKFEIEPSKIHPQATLEDIGIDSLDVFDIVFAIEEQLGIKVSNDDVKIAVFQDLVDLIDRLRREQGKA